ncbi:AAA family ATPase [Pycnococcus provasolii]
MMASRTSQVRDSGLGLTFWVASSAAAASAALSLGYYYWSRYSAEHGGAAGSTHAAGGDAGTPRSRVHWGRAAAVWATKAIHADFISLKALRNLTETFDFAGKGGKEAIETNAHIHTKSGHPVYVIVLTGGPCGGKSTGLSHLNERLSALGFRVYASPEAATILISTGARPTFTGAKPWTVDTLNIFQEGIVSLSISLEESLIALALSRDEPAVIVCDRGVADLRAYISDDVYSQALSQFKLTPEQAFQRYDAIVHLVSAAVGAESSYTTANNAARLETAEEAAALDEKTQKAWKGHPRHFVVDNSTDFTGKIRRVTQAIAEVVGLPESASDVRRRFRVEHVDALKCIPDNHVASRVTRTYLKSKQWASEGVVACVTMRETDGTGENYVHRLARPSDHYQVERMLAKRDYETAIEHHADPDASLIIKTCRTFTVPGIENGKETNLFCSLETYEAPAKLKGESFLNTNAQSLSSSIELKGAIGAHIGKEVTSDRAYLEPVLAGVFLKA